MFRIGEFAQIAQVSSRQLRFYDQLGLLQPAHTDSQTGYRYYSVRQLPRLNCILALKELGLSLEQIGPLLKDEISPSELRGMLTMKRAQVERALREDEIRLRHIESRIAQIDKSGRIDGQKVPGTGAILPVEIVEGVAQRSNPRPGAGKDARCRPAVKALSLRGPSAGCCRY